MYLTLRDDTLEVHGLDYISATNAAGFRDAVRSRIDAAHPIVEVDCTTIRFIDSEGLGALISVHRSLLQHQGRIRLIHASPLVRKLIQLLHFDEILELSA